MPGFPYELEPRGNTVQVDYEHRVDYLYRLLSFHEWNQLEVERGDPLDRSGQRRRRISLAFLSLTRPAHHSLAVMLRSRPDSWGRAALLVVSDTPGSIGDEEALLLCPSCSPRIVVRCALPVTVVE